jgi:hypothetical protein
MTISRGSVRSTSQQLSNLTLVFRSVTILDLGPIARSLAFLASLLCLIARPAHVLAQLFEGDAIRSLFGSGCRPILLWPSAVPSSVALAPGRGDIGREHRNGLLDFADLALEPPELRGPRETRPDVLLPFPFQPLRNP